jgi:hypothetical protein
MLSKYQVFLSGKYGRQPDDSELLAQLIVGNMPQINQAKCSIIIGLYAYSGIAVGLETSGMAKN